MFSRIRLQSTTLVVLVSVFVASRALGQPDDPARVQAASLFDQGVREFSAEHYEAAARAFLAAAELLPNKQALNNALAAASRAARPVLVARAAQRLLERGDLDDASRRAAQSALDDVSPKLARVDVRCEPVPCSVRVDGERGALGVDFVAPGEHEFVAENIAGTTARLRAACGAGASCPILLRLPAVPAPQATEPTDTGPAAAAASAVPAGQASEPRAREPETSAPQASESRARESEPSRATVRRPVPGLRTVAPGGVAAKRPGTTPSTEKQLVVRSRNAVPGRSTTRAETPARLPRVAFATAAAGTLVFAALTTWSGVEAVQARNLHEEDPARYDREETRRLARRTDYFLASSVVLAAATAAIGLWWVDFGAGRRAQLALLPGRTLTVSAEGRF